MKINALTAGLTAAVLLSGSSMTASAQDTYAAKDGTLFYYSVTDQSKLEISIDSAVLPEGSGELVIPETIGSYTVTGISDRAFFGCTAMASVSLPDTLTHIGDYSFSGCFGLTSAVIPDSVTKMGTGCFASCGSLSEAKLSKSITAVPDECFAACSDLKDALLPAGLTSIGSEAFYGCGELTLFVPDTVTEIGSNAIGMHFDLRTGLLEPFDDFLVLGAGGSAIEAYAYAMDMDFIDPDDGLAGDVDADGIVDSADSSAVLEEYANVSTGEKPSFSRAQNFRADLNSDRITDSSDASEILEIYVRQQTQD